MESMTNYLARLAEAHSVTLGSLISYVITPILRKKYLTKSTLFDGSRFYENSSALLGIGMSANDIVNQANEGMVNCLSKSLEREEV